jgi:hypothetical protein
VLQFKQDEQVLAETTRALDTLYPNCRCVRNSPNRFYLTLDAETEYIMQADDHIQRDIIHVVMKSFYGKSLCSDQKSVGSSISSYRGSIMIQD